MTNQLFSLIRKSLNENIGFRLNYLDDQLIYEALRSVKNKIPEPDLVKCIISNNSDDVIYQSFLSKILNHESYFFRHFSTIDEIIIPDIIKKDKSEINIWSAGCSSGEEIYSIAISLDRHKDELLPKTKINLLGTDINKSILNKAKEAIYKPWSLRGEVSFDIRQYFDFKNGSYCLKDKIKKQVSFENLNLLKDKFPSYKFDLILCRNVLIYFDSKYIPKVLNKMYRCMDEGSSLVVGHSENSEYFKEKFNLQIIQDLITFQKKMKRSNDKKSAYKHARKSTPEIKNLLKQALSYFRVFKYIESTTKIEEIIKIQHDVYEAHLLKSIIQLNIGNKSMAKILLKNLVKQYPDKYEIYYFLGLIYKEEQEDKKAINWFKESIERNSDNILSLLELKFIYEQLKDINAANYCKSKISRILDIKDPESEVSIYSDITFNDVRTMLL